MKNFIEAVTSPIDYWRTTDSTAVWIGGYVVAAAAFVICGWAAWSFVGGLFAQASMIAGA